MKKLLAPEKTLVDFIPIGRRISEIMKEKGKYYSVSAMANRLGISRETFRLMLKGDREVYTFELEKISSDLKLSVERILQIDIKNVADELDSIFIRSIDRNRLSQLVHRRLEIAIGETEKCDAHTQVGRGYFETRQYELAHDHRIHAYKYALNLHEKYEDIERLNKTLKFLMTSYTAKKDYDGARAIVERVKTVFCDDPMNSGFLSYTLGTIAYATHNYEEARIRLGEALLSFKKTNNTKEIGRAEHNAAYMEYMLGNYETSKVLFERAISTLQEYVEARLISVKDYVKVLIKLDYVESARKLIVSSIEELAEIEFEVLEGKFRFLLAICDNNVSEYLYQNSSTTKDMELMLEYTKDYVKALLEFNEYNKASEILLECRQYLEDYPKLKGKFYLLLAIAKKDISYVEELLSLRETQQYFF